MPVLQCPGSSFQPNKLYKSWPRVRLAAALYSLPHPPSFLHRIAVPASKRMRKGGKKKQKQKEQGKKKERGKNKGPRGSSVVGDWTQLGLWHASCPRRRLDWPDQINQSASPGVPGTGRASCRQAPTPNRATQSNGAAPDSSPGAGIAGSPASQEAERGGEAGESGEEADEGSGNQRLHARLDSFVLFPVGVPHRLSSPRSRLRWIWALGLNWAVRSYSRLYSAVVGWATAYKGRPLSPAGTTDALLLLPKLRLELLSLALSADPAVAVVFCHHLSHSATALLPATLQLRA